ncbi:MAG TPA: 3'-5' exonuclease [Cyclobacteriaceae bacterium]|jgi:DNA helicase-2/ATP-dependent DNA helicase PcrA|nr:3'-5' exonuclease [Cyclobacteriaceae bacterium]
MINSTEQEERNYLEEIKERLSLALHRVASRVREYSEELRQNKQYIYEHQHGLDEADMVAADQSINRMVNVGAGTVDRRRKLMKLVSSPYFGRIDFQTGSDIKETPIYVGLATFTDETLRQNLIYDWRAPISSMFYDFELGDAEYETPSGKVKGTIRLKRQYKIRDGVMEFMIENAVSIHDEVLQRELSKSADDRMKNIVATIQRDQNQVIRNETASVMIIQGVAGSGKTSIALHRIAFLLYRFRDTIKAKDILILSPNKVFADYISNVLPELGEEHIPETGMEDLAAELLEKKFPFQTFFQQVALLLEHPHPEFIARIQFKSSFEFVRLLNKYFIHLENNSFTHTELKVAGVVVPFPFIVEKFKAWQRMPMHKRIPEVVQEVLQFIRNEVKRKLSGGEKAKVWELVPRMFNIRSAFEVYKNFYAWIGKPEMFHMMHGSQLEFADVFPLIYCKIRLEGVQTYDHVKHLLVDEMQDYTPVQYAVLSRVFKCKKTILGDVNQPVNPYSASSAEGIEEVFPQGDVVKLFRSYRSTWEIAQFSLRIVPNPNLIAMERHGEEPQIKGFANSHDETEAIRELVVQFENSGNQSLGIICKTQRQANALHEKIKEHKVHLLTPDSTSFSSGVIITTVHLAKGLEFDEVIVPFVSASNYKSDIDKRMLYIACTRAMHKLTLTYEKERSEFLKW